MCFSADGPVPQLLSAVCDRPGPVPGSLPATRELLLGAHTIKGNLKLEIYFFTFLQKPKPYGSKGQ
jgi:hypothetical protein